MCVPHLTGAEVKECVEAALEAVVLAKWRGGERMVLVSISTKSLVKLLWNSTFAGCCLLSKDFGIQIPCSVVVTAYWQKMGFIEAFCL